jgi:hypothetical protein
VTQVDQEVSKPLRGEGDQGVVTNITVSPRSILARRHTIVQARPLPENIGNMEGGIERRNEKD